MEKKTALEILLEKTKHHTFISAESKSQIPQLRKNILEAMEEYANQFKRAEIKVGDRVYVKQGGVEGEGLCVNVREQYGYCQVLLNGATHKYLLENCHKVAEIKMPSYNQVNEEFPERNSSGTYLDTNMGRREGANWMKKRIIELNK